jgi:hypothetical protein
MRRRQKRMKRVCRAIEPTLNKYKASEMLEDWVGGEAVRFCTKEGKLIKFRRTVV